MNTNYPTLSLSHGLPNVWHIGDNIQVSKFINCDYPFPESFRIRDFVIIYLQKGRLAGKKNGKDTLYVGPCMITIQPKDIYEYSFSDEHVEATVVAYSTSFTERLNLINRFQLNDIFLKTPAIKLNEQTEGQLNEYIEKVVELGRNPHNPFMDEALTHLTLSFFYSFGFNYYQIKHQSSRPHQITEQFIELVQQYGATEHSICFYADQMHLSSKYIQFVVKETTGRSACAWIEDEVIRRAKQLLYESNLTMQQIAAELHFCDQSYFGAYFKRVTGYTPRGFRIRKSN